MPGNRILLSESLLVVVDIQSGLLPHVFEPSRLTDRSAFLVRIARLLDVPVIVTEQNPTRMGATAPDLAQHLEGVAIYEKTCFAASDSPAFMAGVLESGRSQIILLGLETHICVSQTTNGLLNSGFNVFVCPDGVSARSQERHKLGMERIRDSGGTPAHTEAVAYEWLETSEHPQFRSALAIVKEYP